MRKLVCSFLLIAAASALAAEIDVFDQKVANELRTLDPGSVDLWTKGNALRAAGKHEEARVIYEQLYARVPKSTHALRRMANEEIELGRTKAGVQHLRDAVAIERSPENLAALALQLSDKEEKPAEALPFAKEAAAKSPNDLFVKQVLGQTAWRANDLEAMRDATNQLMVLAPKEPGTHLLKCVIAVADGEWSAARAQLEESKRLGLPRASYENVLGQINEGEPFYLRWWKPALIAFGSWFAAFALLLAFGALLSHAAMRAARETPQHLGDNTTDLSATVRRVYRIVLLASCFFYCASIPIVILLIIAVFGGLIYACFALGQVPIKLVAFAVIVGGVSIWSMLKTLFIKTDDDEPGMRLDMSGQPRLRALLDDVAAKIDTRPVDNVYLTPGSDLAVMQRGKGRHERCLILGIGVLSGLKVRPFKAILGHEYGHFSNRDTAGGEFALAVRRSLGATAYALAMHGVARWYNPAWQFVRGFNRVFLRISEGASRLQEILADRWAVFAYGADAFEQGLRHVVERSVRFDTQASAVLSEVIERKIPLANLYTYEPAKSAKAEDIEKQVADSLNREASAYDSHPSPSERFALVHALPAHAIARASDDDDEVLSVFDNLLDLQHAMTARVRANVAMNYGVAIAGPEPATVS